MELTIMPEPIKKIINNREVLVCPVDGKILDKTVIVYNEIVNGVFRGTRKVTETTYECPYCHWSYPTREVK